MWERGGVLQSIWNRWGDDDSSCSSDPTWDGCEEADSGSETDWTADEEAEEVPQLIPQLVVRGGGRRSKRQRRDGTPANGNVRAPVHGEDQRSVFFEDSGAGIAGPSLNGPAANSVSETLPTDSSPPTGSRATGADDEQRSVPRGRSDAHFHIVDKKIVYLSFDLEHGGADCGIVQLSGELVRMDLVGTRPRSDTAQNIQRLSATFNAYVNPGDGAIWDEEASRVNGLTRSDPRIRQASDIDAVWADFKKWISDNTERDDIIVLVAWNGKSCDLKWLWKLTQAPRSTLSMPTKIQYFIDPYRVIQKYTKGGLHPNVSKIDSLELGVVWHYIMKKNFNAKHDSLEDAKAQTDIILHPEFVRYIDTSFGVQDIEDIFTKTQRKEFEKSMESVRPVHQPWIEVTTDSDITWEPERPDRYEGPAGGATPGPSAWIQQIVRGADTLACIFLALVPWAFFIKVASLSQAYAYTDWVVEKRGTDRDGNPRKKTHFKACKEGDPGCRHRADHRKDRRWTFTPGYVLCWFAIVILQGAHFGSKKRDSRRMWRRTPRGLSIPYVRNAMPLGAYEYMRSYIHFADNSKWIAKGSPGYDTLFKVRYPMTLFMRGISKAWVAGKHVTIDESMITYVGRAVSYVQYMPAKPIKHGLKVYALCCACSAVLLAFQVYVGKEDDETENSAVPICHRLCRQAGITGERGHVLYTDNWYTGMALCKQFFEEYGWTVVGTISATDKKARADGDIPFLILSKGARNALERGWFREAVIQMKTKTGKTYYIQCTTWRDKKQVCFLSSNRVGASEGLTVRRHTKKRKQREVLAAPRAQRDYVRFFAAVDRNDRDSSDYSTTIRTCRYYLRIMCWILDRVVHTMYVVVVACVSAGIGKREWSEYALTHNGRVNIQIDLAIALMHYAIDREWDGEGERPGWMRQKDFLPCDCRKCYFCLKGHTTGIAHKKKTRVKVFSSRTGLSTWTDKCTDVAVNLGRGGAICRMCMRKNKGTLNKDGTKLSCVQRRRLPSTGTSRMGCPQCDETICQDCWKEGYDKHIGMSK